MRDPIVEEVRKIRQEHASRFNFDLRAICEDLKEKQKKWGDRLVSLPPKKSARAMKSP